ncbi:hypothetical protein P7C70_g3039, partial [Phenoliferia sp. Uapishka_3]
MPGLINSFAQTGITQVAIPPHKYSDLLEKGPFKDELRQALATDGYYIVKGAIPKERGLEYRDRAHSWLEDFKLGYDRNDESTWTNEHLPPHIKGGMFSAPSKVYHESWVWDIRTEPGVMDAFAKLWGTKELTTSFDGASVMLPRRKDLPPPSSADKWEHMDQSPNRTGFFGQHFLLPPSDAQPCMNPISLSLKVAQGLVNLNYNGPKDGGLLVMKGSSVLINEYFATFPEEKANSGSWGPADWYGFTKAQQTWFLSKGCEWVKVCLEPGDMVLWDSRTIHYNRRPSGDVDRVCTYVCMAPVELLNDADRATKQELFKTFGATYPQTHNPFENIFVREKVEGPLQKPITNPSETILKLSAMMPY